MMPNHPQIHSGLYGYLKQLRQLNISDFYSLCIEQRIGIQKLIINSIQVLTNSIPK
jgi:hypothetical protein